MGEIKTDKSFYILMKMTLQQLQYKRKKGLQLGENNAWKKEGMTYRIIQTRDFKLFQQISVLLSEKNIYSQ